MNNLILKSIREGGHGVGTKLSQRSQLVLMDKASSFLGLVASHVSLKGIVITGMMLVLVLLSAIGVVYSSHMSRQLFSEQAVLLERNDQLQLEWAQLLLEQSAWSSPNRIESVASEKLGMVMPETEQIELIY